MKNRNSPFWHNIAYLPHRTGINPRRKHIENTTCVNNITGSPYITDLTIAVINISALELPTSSDFQQTVYMWTIFSTTYCDTEHCVTESFLETDLNAKSDVERVLFDISVYVLITLVLSKLCGCRCNGGTIIIRNFDHKDNNTLIIFCFTEQG